MSSFLQKLIWGCLILVSFSVSVYAQQGSGFGFKGGLNYTTSGKYFKDAGAIFSNPQANMGYHAGIFYQMTSGNSALRPELILTQTQFESSLGQVKTQKIDLPILVRVKFFEIIGLSLGPSFRYIITEEFSNPANFETSDPWGLGFQLGLGVNLGPVGLDLRFERELNERKFTFDNVLGKEDYKSQQLILGLSFKIPNKK